MLSSAACFALHPGVPVPGPADTWISLLIDARVTARYAHVVRSRLAQGCPSRANPCEVWLAPHMAAKPRVILGGISADGITVAADPNRAVPVVHRLLSGRRSAR
jgi:hypothetical protein